MHPNEMIPRDLGQDKDLLLTYVYCCWQLSPQVQKRRINGEIIEIKPNQALVEVPLPQSLPIGQDVFEEKLEVLRKLELARIEPRDKHLVITFPKLRVFSQRPSVIVDDEYPDFPSITFECFSERYLQQVECDTSPKNLENSRRVVKHANKRFGNILLSKLEPHHLEEFKQKRLDEIRAKKGSSSVGKTTVNMDVRTLKRALEYAIDWGYLKDNPFRRVKSIRTEAKKPMAMSPEDFTTMLMEVEDLQLQKFYRVLVLTGMRRGELLYLTWENVDFDNRTIHIESSAMYRVKGGAGRSLPITNEVEKILKSLERNDPYVFMDERAKPYHEDYITKKFKKAIRDAELDGRYHLHCLRHTFATWLAASGVPMVVIKELLGHAYLKTTEAYTKIPTNEMRKALDQLTMPPA